MISLLVLFSAASFAQTTNVQSFDKIIISPHIAVTFVEGDAETVMVEHSNVAKEKIHIEVNNKTLRVYLEGAKEWTKNEKGTDEDNKQPLYKGTQVTAVITYKMLNELSVRGEETQVCKSTLKGDKFRLKIYGTEKVILQDVELNELAVTSYGESSLVIKAGTINSQSYTAYGESSINSLAIKGSYVKIVAYGESDFAVNVSDELKITAFGESKVKYKGNPKISRGIRIGEVTVSQID